MRWGENYKFAETEEIVDAVRDVTPSDRYVDVIDPESVDDEDVHRVRKVGWVSPDGYLLKIPAKNVLFMTGNIWNLRHARALYENIKRGIDLMNVPPARVYRVDRDRIESTQRYEAEGQLLEQTGMQEPWTPKEEGEYYAQLLDGNHRAAAALLAGEPYIYVYVVENTRDEVLPTDWA